MAKVERYYVLSSDEYNSLKSQSERLPSQDQKSCVGGIGMNINSIGKQTQYRNYGQNNSFPFNSNADVRNLSERSQDCSSIIFEAIPLELRSNCERILHHLNEIPGFFISPENLAVGMGGQTFPRSNVIEILYGLMDNRLRPEFIPGCKFCLALLSELDSVPYEFIKNHSALRSTMKYRKEKMKKIYHMKRLGNHIGHFK